MNTHRGPMPVAFFGIAVGLFALANAWRVASRIWPVPASVAQLLTLGAFAVWLVLGAAYAHKWIAHRAEARAELQHPVQSSFVALVPVSALLAAGALLNYSHVAAVALFWLAAASGLALGVFLQGRLFVAATASAAFGWHQLGMLFFGAGALSWLAIESLILHRAAVHEALPEALRPTLGIQLAPPVVGGVAYLSLTSGAPDLFAYLLLGYGIYQALLLLRLLPWIRQQAFAPSYWAFSFGVAALPTMAMRMVERGASGQEAWLAAGLFVLANLAIAVLVVMTLRQLWQGKLLPASAPAAAARPQSPGGARPAAAAVGAH